MKVLKMVLLAGMVLAVVGLIIKSDNDEDANSKGEASGAPQNVSVEGGKQVVTIAVHEGYSPGTTLAKAGIPTVIRFVTSSTFDCSAAIRIPSLNLFQTLPPSGSFDANIGSPLAGTLVGTCGMGMYQFRVQFQNT